MVLKKYRPKIIAVTGTVGKTSTKDVVASVMEGLAFTRKSEKSFNSELGVPLTILGLPNKWNSIVGWLTNMIEGMMPLLYRINYPKWLVLEMGADKPGDIEALMKWITPDISIITAIGDVPVHVEFYDSVDDVLQEKLWLMRGLKRGGTLILNYDDERLRNTNIREDIAVCTYGFTKKADVVASHMDVLEENSEVVGITTKAKIGKNVFPLKIRGVLGSQQVYPCIAAIAVAHVLSANMLIALQAIEKRKPAPGRMRILSGIRNSLLIDDTYNSSPLAMSAALEALKETPAKRRMAILGHMAELGEYSVEEHKKLGKHAVEVADLILTSGSLAESIAEVARQHKGAGSVVSFSGPENLAQYISAKIKPGDVILIKGSQSARMEKATKLLLAKPEDAEHLLVRQEDEWRGR